MNEAPSPDYLGKNRIDVRDIKRPNAILGSIPINRVEVYGFIISRLEVNRNEFQDVVQVPQSDLPLLRQIPSFMEYIPALREADIL